MAFRQKTGQLMPPRQNNMQILKSNLIFQAKWAITHHYM